MRTTVLAGALLASAALAPAAHADRPGATAAPRVLPAPVPGPSFCWLDTRLFHTLRLGPVSFCRRHLRYRPGRLECYQFTDQVCATFDPVNGFVQSRSPVNTQVFPCPAGPDPPVCRALDLPALP